MRFELETIKEQIKEYPDFLKKEQVLEILQISERTFYRLVHSAQLEATKVGGTWRVPKLAVLKYLQEKNCLNFD